MNKEYQIGQSIVTVIDEIIPGKKYHPDILWIFVGERCRQTAPRKDFNLSDYLPISTET